MAYAKVDEVLPFLLVGTRWTNMISLRLEIKFIPNGHKCDGCGQYGYVRPYTLKVHQRACKGPQE
jgi:hypothetical protein